MLARFPVPEAEAKKGGEYTHYHKLHRGTTRNGYAKKRDGTFAYEQT